jgi:hypothetical protein
LGLVARQRRCRGEEEAEETKEEEAAEATATATGIVRYRPAAMWQLMHLHRRVLWRMFRR